MSLREWLNACRGYREKMGGGDGASEGMSRSRFEELLKEHPDTPPQASAPAPVAG